MLVPPPVSAWLLIVLVRQYFEKIITFESVKYYFMAWTPCTYGVWGSIPVACLLHYLMCIIGRGCGLIVVDTPTHSETSDW